MTPLFHLFIYVQWIQSHFGIAIVNRVINVRTHKYSTSNTQPSVTRIYSIYVFLYISIFFILIISIILSNFSLQATWHHSTPFNTKDSISHFSQHVISNTKLMQDDLHICSTCMDAHMCVCLCAGAHEHRYVHMHVHLSIHMHICYWYICMSVCMYIYMYAYVCVYACHLYTYMCIQMYISIHECMNVWMNITMCGHTHSSVMMCKNLWERSFVRAQRCVNNIKINK